MRPSLREPYEVHSQVNEQKLLVNLTGANGHIALDLPISQQENIHVGSEFALEQIQTKVSLAKTAYKPDLEMRERRLDVI
jgi:hypothetical protein